jgi:hypothetical protein
LELSTDNAEYRIADDQSSALFSYYGYAFESYSTVKDVPVARDIGRNLDWTEDMNVDTNEQWCCIVKSKIAHTRLYMGGEVDCVEGKSGAAHTLSKLTREIHAGEWRDSLTDCVELKTNMLIIKDSKGQTNFERSVQGLIE